MKILTSYTAFDDLAPHLEYHHWQAIVNGQSVETAFDIWKPIRDEGLLHRVSDLYEHIRELVVATAEKIKADAQEIMTLFETRPMFAFFKAIRFSVGLLIRPLQAFARLYQQGLLGIFSKLQKEGVFQKLNDGAVKLDQVLNQHPLLKKLTGPAVAGLFIWMFLSANFTYQPGLDMDMTLLIKAALFGNWSAADLFTSPKGLLSITMLLTGLLIPWPTPLWLRSSPPTNIMIALFYTACRHAPPTTQVKQLLLQLKTKIKFLTVR